MSTLDQLTEGISTRPLHFIWIVDNSGSMDGAKIQSVNYAIDAALPAMRQTAEGSPEARVLCRAIRFGVGADWHVSRPTEVKDFRWEPMTAAGDRTDLGKAMALLADALKVQALGKRGLPPVLVLLSDGQPTDDFGAGLQKLMAEPWAQKSVRIAFAIGDDADHGPLQKFIGHNERTPLKVENAAQLVEYTRFTCTSVLGAASKPNTSSGGSGPTADVVAVPVPAPAPAGGSAAGQKDF